MKEKLLLDYEFKGLEYNFNPDELKFLDLSGRKAFYSQGIYGQGIIVAVLDTGVSSRHPELRGRVLKGKNFVSGGLFSDSEDDNGHGTHVAATIAGRNVGIAPKVEILPVKILDENGEGSWSDNVMPSFEWVRNYRSKDGRKVSIVSMSLGGKNISDKEKRIMEEEIKKLVKDNIAVIVAAGNSGKEELYYPGAFNDVICVGAVDLSKEKAMFSTMGSQVDLCQVGVDVLSAWYKGGYKKLSGTSMATPIVSGIGALIACKHSILLGEDIQEDYLWKNLKMNTKDIGAKGVDKIFGAGFSTLQPLEANIVVRENGNKIEVNGQKVGIKRDINRDGETFTIPLSVLQNATGCIVNISDNNEEAKVIY